MTEQTVKILTIMATNHAGDVFYPDYVAQDEDDEGEFDFSVTNHIEDSVDLNDTNKDKHLEIFDAFTRAYDGEYIDIKLINATVTTLIEDVVIKDEYAEILQKNALSKLTPSEVKALGITNLLTYIKLKFHKAA